MFRWYKQSAVCYAYFTDVQDTDPAKVHDALATARWFTRGWTLQELLAPREMELYAYGWKRIGTRTSLCESLSKITGIEVSYLCGLAPLEDASVSKRMSWAARRETTRTEDLAYCLLGLFDVNMPLLYGEGKKAFRRLQEEIMKANPTDHTLFAWGRLVEQPRRQVYDISQLQGLESIPWDATEASMALRGLFADSPKDFLHSAGFSPWRGTGSYYNPFMRVSPTPVLYPNTTGTGVSIELPVLPSAALSVFHWPNLQLTQLRPLRFAVLLCEHGNNRAPVIVLPLQPWGFSRYGRTDELMFFENTYDVGGLIRIRESLHIEPQKHRDPQGGDFLIRRWGDTWWYEQSLENYHIGVMSITAEAIVIAPNGGPMGRVWGSYCRLSKTDQKMGFGIVFARVPPEHGSSDDFGPVSVSLVPLMIDEPKTAPVVGMDGYTWFHKSILEPDKFKSLFERRMTLPEDTWRLNVAPFPNITVHVKRVSIGPGSADIVDVVDITILDRIPKQLPN
jgi:hypothetical protein